mmetsp:Transcript_15703/g.26472  ORF Transcript_15703/g.26472 Transcript_15703/m.26472 type:complete len:129 (-) Transcript_15703:181-567(-)
MLAFGTGVFGSVEFAMTQLPTLVLFQRLTPDHVESTMMAFAASAVNLSNGLVGDLMGVAINDWFVGVSGSDLSKYYQLSLVSIVFVIYELFIIRLIPLREDVEKEFNPQNQRAQMEPHLEEEHLTIHH